MPSLSSCFLPCYYLKESHQLKNSTLQNTHKFLPIKEKQRVKVVSVYDGDTITIAAKCGGTFSGMKPTLFKVRLNGIDTPEMKGKGVTAKEKKLALIAKEALSDRILGKIIRLENIGFEKYGRVLADVVTLEGENLCEWMVKEGYAKRYDGGKKDTDWGDNRV